MRELLFIYMEELHETTYHLRSTTPPFLFYGPNEKNIALLEENFDLRIIPRGSSIKLIGTSYEIEIFQQILSELENIIDRQKSLSEQDVLTAIRIYKSNTPLEAPPATVSIDWELPAGEILQTFTKSIKAKSEGQLELVKAIAANDLVFAIGPAGTGKTYLAVAMAVSALKDGKVKKIVLARPAVEAGESLGFLPGDFKEKVDPYLKPLYDALSEMIPREALRKYFDYETIEVVPLAFMRGRTLSNAFVILDEAQNSTFVQMKMFLTRLGYNSKAVVTGDVTQIDLEPGKQSGLASIYNVLKDIKGIRFIYTSNADVVRHTLVKDIIDAYDRFTGSSKNKHKDKDE